MSKRFKLTYVILHIISAFVSILLIGIAGDYARAGECKELLFIFAALVNTIPFIFVWTYVWILCFKSVIRKKLQNLYIENKENK